MLTNRLLRFWGIMMRIPVRLDFWTCVPKLYDRLMAALPTLAAGTPPLADLQICRSRSGNIFYGNPSEIGKGICAALCVSAASSL